MKLSQAEWSVMEVLWDGSEFSLKEITDALEPVQGWNRKTVFTYLSRMEGKGLIAIDRSKTHPYSAAVSREACAREERDELLTKVYSGAAGDLIAAFLKESKISREEVEKLRRMLDDMEV